DRSGRAARRALFRFREVIVSDRKYKHHGYQDSSYSSQKPSQPSSGGPPRELFRQERLEGATRGRTAGGFGPEAFNCNEFGELRNILGDCTPETTCMKCSADLHTCGNCRSFDTTTMWECR